MNLGNDDPYGGGYNSSYNQHRHIVSNGYGDYPQAPAQHQHIQQHQQQQPQQPHTQYYTTAATPVRGYEASMGAPRYETHTVHAAPNQGHIINLGVASNSYGQPQGHSGVQTHAHQHMSVSHPTAMQVSFEHANQLAAIHYHNEEVNEHRRSQLRQQQSYLMSQIRMREQQQQQLQEEREKEKLDAERNQKMIAEAVKHDQSQRDNQQHHHQQQHQQMQQVESSSDPSNAVNLVTRAFENLQQKARQAQLASHETALAEQQQRYDAKKLDMAIRLKQGLEFFGHNTTFIDEQKNKLEQQQQEVEAQKIRVEYDYLQHKKRLREETQQNAERELLHIEEQHRQEGERQKEFAAQQRAQQHHNMYGNSTFGNYPAHSSAVQVVRDQQQSQPNMPHYAAGNGEVYVQPNTTATSYITTTTLPANVARQHIYASNAAPSVATYEYATEYPHGIPTEFQHVATNNIYNTQVEGRMSQQELNQAMLRDQVVDLRRRASRNSIHSQGQAVISGHHSIHEGAASNQIKLEKVHIQTDDGRVAFEQEAPSPNSTKISQQIYASSINETKISSHPSITTVQHADVSERNSMQNSNLEETETAQAHPTYTTLLLKGAVSPSPPPGVKLDPWWPDAATINSERVQREKFKILKSKSADVCKPVTEKDDSVEGALDSSNKKLYIQKVPHCRIHNHKLRESGGVIFKKGENNVPLFCWQVTELYPTEVMVCCSRCHTWRHACCGGHHNYEGYDTIPTDMPSKFEALCDLCHEEDIRSKENMEDEVDMEENVEHEEMQKVLKDARLNHYKRTCAMNEICRHATFHKYGGTYKWPIGSVTSTHINGHTRSVYGRQEKAMKMLRDMVTKLGNGLGSAARPKERIKVRQKELEKLMGIYEDAEKFVDHHNMKLFLHMDTSAEYPAGYEPEKRNTGYNFFDPADDEYQNCNNEKKIEEDKKEIDLVSESGAETNLCIRPNCTRKARFDSAFCSDGCGINVHETHLLQILEYAEDIHPTLLRS